MGWISRFLVLAASVVSVLGQCPSGWVKSNNYCYFYNNNDTISWGNAISDCKSRAAALLRIESTDEWNFVKQNMVMNPNGNGYWTSLNDRDRDAADPDNDGTGTWMWGTTEEVSDLVTNNWDVDPDTFADEHCVAINMAATLSNEPCSSKRGYICELDNNGNGCPYGWLIGPSDCFWVSNITDPTQIMTWDAANTACQGMDTGGQGTAHLVTLNNAADSNYFSVNMPTSWSIETTKLWWTDLTDKNSKGTFYWANNDAYNPSYVKWLKEPDNIAGREHCGTIMEKGTFADRNCKQLNNYICRKEIPTNTYLTNFGCGDWQRAGHKCYQAYNKPQKSWSDAQTFCSGIGGKLMKIESKDEMSWLSYESQTTRMRDSGYWIGLTDSSSRWRWTDGSSADTSFLLWNQQPDDYGGQQDCATISIDGVFSDQDCKLHKAGFICEKPRKSSGCPSSWVGNAQRCYYMGAQFATYLESISKCNTLSGDASGVLLAINTQDEMNFVLTLLGKVTKGPLYFWTGLTDVITEGVWQYTNIADNTATALGLVQWNSEPNNFQGKEHCVAAAYGARLNDQKCSLLTGFICEKYAAGYNGALPTLPFSKMTFTLAALAAIALSRNQ